ncbi:hypothetical protein QAD02_015374 [Eretmocerus hayati]|uniref:Uncharacterized protein n=1 Tax=Eretmocerus hayati TaxID=131215 RepID=A0ACC2PAV4_9HYME|nr:hypothetical protein QAD02_015374 [Eretmocerus hayati]
MDSIRNELFAKIKAAGKDVEMTLKFKQMGSDELRVMMALVVMDTFKTIPPSKCIKKDAKISTDVRNKANRIFVSCKDDIKLLMKAWELYSESIATAPNKSQELSLAYANRSALLLKFRKYQDCVEDINRALSLNYPNHMKGKLWHRKIECLRIMKDSREIDRTIEESKKWLEGINLNGDEKEKFETKMKDVENSNWCAPDQETHTRESPVFYPSRSIPCASEAIEIKYNDKFGRHLVTTRRVHPGEILIMEKPFAKILKPEEVFTHCSQCLQLCWSLTPCEFCVHAMYCSTKCKDEAWEQYHDVECDVTGNLLSLDFDKSILFSMRLAILAIRELGNIKNLRNHVKQSESSTDLLKKGFAEDGLYHSDKYLSVHSLVTNTEKRSVPDLFARALNAAFILYYLSTLTILFGKKFEPNFQELSMNEDITFIGGLLLRHLQIIPSNIHCYEEERGIDTVDIGASALPFCSLVNHSCDPNVSRCSTKEHMIIFALLPIENGAQIYDNYGSHYAVMDKTEREKKLDQFHFKCECIACLRDWPIYEDLPSFHDLLPSGEMKKKVEKALEKFNLYVDYATEDKIDCEPNLMEDLTKMLNILLQCVPLPCREVNNVMETLKRTFALKYGNKFEIPSIHSNQS